MEYSTKPLLTKEEFTSYIRFIRERQNAQLKFCAALDTLSPSTYNDAFVYSDYQEKLVEAVGHMMGDKGDLMGYYLYELDILSIEDEKEFAEKVEKLYNEILNGGGSEDVR